MNVIYNEKQLSCQTIIFYLKICFSIFFLRILYIFCSKIESHKPFVRFLCFLCFKFDTSMFHKKNAVLYQQKKLPTRKESPMRSDVYCYGLMFASFIFLQSVLLLMPNFLAASCLLPFVVSNIS